MPKRLNFTKRTLLALRPPEAGRVYVYDIKTPNLALCVAATGVMTFYRYGKVNGRPERIHIGRFPDVTVEMARDACRDITGRVARGEDPQQERRKRGGLTFPQLFARYLEEYAKPHKKTWQHDEYQFKRYLAMWHTWKVANVTRNDVQRWHVHLGETIGETTANRARALLSKLFAFAIENDLHTHNPCVGVRKYRERSRERFVQSDELPRLFAALGKCRNQTFADFVRISLFVGARSGNTLRMRWDEISLARAEWRIPETKAGTAVVIPIPKAALDILRRRQTDADGSPWVFPSHGRSGHLASPQKSWERLCDTAGIEGLTIHDLRRSLGSWQAAAGSSELIIGKSLGHAAGSRATSVYARLNVDPVRDSMETATAAMVAAAKTEGESNA